MLATTEFARTWTWVLGPSPPLPFPPPADEADMVNLDLTSCFTLVTAVPAKKKMPKNKNGADQGWMAWTMAVSAATTSPAGVRDRLEYARYRSAAMSGIAIMGFIIARGRRARRRVERFVDVCCLFRRRRWKLRLREAQPLLIDNSERPNPNEEELHTVALRTHNIYAFYTAQHRRRTFSAKPVESYHYEKKVVFQRLY